MGWKKRMQTADKAAAMPLGQIAGSSWGCPTVLSLFSKKKFIAKSGAVEI